MNCIPERFTTIINIFGGPGVGKSTAAAALYVAMKKRGISCEYVPEFAKELSRKGDYSTLDNQFYVSAVQYNRILDLIGKVYYIITDAPVLQGHVYDRQKLNGFYHVLNDIQYQYHTLNILLQRDQEQEYDNEGRHHTESEAREIDIRIEALLQEAGVPFARISANDTDVLINYVFSEVE